MSIDEKQRYIDILKNSMSEKRFLHTMGVVKTAVELAGKNGIDIDKAETAALLHDIAKPIDKQELKALACNYNIDTDGPEAILHGPVGAHIVKERFGITDEDILSAIYYHTTGRENMSKLEKLIYISDLIEETRCFPGIDELRELCFKDLEKGVLEGMAHVLIYLIENKREIDNLSISAYNYMLKNGGTEIDKQI